MVGTGINSEQQRKHFHRLLQHAWQHSAFYRDYYGSDGITENDLNEVAVRDLPLLTKKILMENFDRAVTDPRLRKKELEEWADVNTDPAQNYRKDVVVIRTSGTSGFQGLVVYSEAIWRTANAMITKYIRPPPNYPSRSKLAWFVDSHRSWGADVSLAKRISPALFDTLILSLDENWSSTVAKLNTFQPHRLTGYSSVIARLADAALDGRLTISPQDIIVSGDLLTDGMRTKLQEAWKAAITVIYAASESPYIAIMGPEQTNLRVIDELNYLEVIGLDDRLVSIGERGRAVVTNLHNYLLPILRYELGDYVELCNQQVGCAASIQSIQGRENNALPVVLRNGRRGSIHPMVFPIYVSGVEKMQIISQRPDHVRIAYVAKETRDKAISTEFQKILRNFDADGTTFEIHKVAHIPNDPKTGKFALIKLEADAVSLSVDSPSNLSGTGAPYSLATVQRPKSALTLGREDIGESIVARFERAVQIYPNRPAVSTRSTLLAYKELNSVANCLARAIQNLLGEGEEPVALLLENGAPIITAILGVLKAGKLYMPLDPSHPKERLEATLEASQTRLILTNNRGRVKLGDYTGHGLHVLDLDETTANFSLENLAFPASGNTRACILYTSGSTGEPKGVVHSHRNVLHKTSTYTNDLHLCPEDRIALLSPCTFSLSVGFIFGALLNGACLYPVDVKAEGLAHLANWFAQEKITIYNSVPAIFRKFTDTLARGENLPHLRLIHLGGEALTEKDVELVRKYFSSECILLSLWGCSETGTIAQCLVDKTSRFNGDSMLAGSPGSGSEILVLDDEGNALGFNQVGEIAVKSEYLAMEYWRNPVLTRAAFLSDPKGGKQRIYRTGDLGLLRSDGLVEYHGRKDLQIKIRGQKVAVVEIEMALAKHAAIKAAIVTAQENSLGDQYLVAYVMPAQNTMPPTKELQVFLQQRLPEHMVPSIFVVLDSFPLTPNGKLDRKALQEPEKIRRLNISGVPPRTPIEKTLAKIWMEVLSVDRVGIHDDFFDLGGHSLTAMQVVSRAIKKFRLELPLQSLFVSPTVAAMAVLIREHQKKQLVEKLERTLAGVESLSDEESNRILAEETTLTIKRDREG